MLAFQIVQFNYQKKQDQTFEAMFLDTFEHQRKIDAEERQKDRDFFLELRKIFSGNK